jgi:hypothetical protein
MFSLGVLDAEAAVVHEADVFALLHAELDGPAVGLDVPLLKPKRTST